jgi:hypothetical protein
MRELRRASGENILELAGWMMKALVSAMAPGDFSRKKAVRRYRGT